MNPQPPIESVSKSTWQYIEGHDIWYVAILVTIGFVLMYLLPTFSFHIIAFVIAAPLLVGYSRINSKIRHQFTQEFGQAIGYSYSEAGDLASVQGKVFNIGDGQKIFDVLSGTYHDIPNRIFNYQFTTGSGKSQQTHQFTFFEAVFNNNMPDIVLTSNYTSFTSLWNLGEHIKLEGDFNAYFSLYVPKGYETEAYEIFTPDVMAKLIDQAKNLNFEFNGNKLYIYMTSLISTKEKMQTMFNLADYLIETFNRSAAGVKI